jgi:hypothetical protein
MGPEKKNPEKTSFQKNSEKNGWVKRFWDWLSRGVDEAKMKGKSCPN